MPMCEVFEFLEKNSGKIVVTFNRSGNLAVLLDLEPWKTYWPTLFYEKRHLIVRYLEKLYESLP